MKTSIYINYFKNTARIESNVLKPLHLGALNSTFSLDMLRDDTGINISEKNKYYCEITGLYWAWKNNTESEYLGFFHYRRLFDFDHEKDRIIRSDQLIHYHGIDDYLFEKFQITDAKIESLTDEYDAIIPHPINTSKGETVKEQYHSSPHHHPEDLGITRDIVEKLSPEYLATFDTVLGGHSFHTTSMFIFKRSLFNKLCTWLFRILDELHEQLDYGKYDHPQEMRTVGYVAERLISVFIFQEIINNPEIKYIELNRVFIKDTNPLPSEPDLPKTELPVISITVSSDQNYVPHLGALIASIASNLSINKYLEIIILDGGLNSMHKKLLNKLLDLHPNFSLLFMDMSMLYDDIPMHSFFTKATLYRLALPQILKKRSKILFLDTDMVVTEDLSSLFEKKLGDHYLAAAPDLIMKTFCNKQVSCLDEIFRGDADTYLKKYVGLKDPSNYFQAGTLLLNLRKLRDDNMSGKMIEDMRSRRYWFLDQDILNRHLSHNIIHISNKYNCVDIPQSYREALNEDESKLFYDSMADPYIIHYAGVGKPWLNNEHGNSHFYWNYLRMTSWYETVLFNFLNLHLRGEGEKHPISLPCINRESSTQKTTLKRRLARIKRKYIKPLTKTK